MEKMIGYTVIFFHQRGEFTMTKLSKTKLINLSCKYVTIPSRKRDIDYKYFYNTSKLSFYKEMNANLYLVEISFTFFDNEYVLDIQQSNCADRSDFKRKFIRLGSDFPVI